MMQQAFRPVNVERVLDAVMLENAEILRNMHESRIEGYLVGQVMKVTKGKANPAKVIEAIRNRILT